MSAQKWKPSALDVQYLVEISEVAWQRKLNIQTSLLLALIRTLANVTNPTVRIPKMY